MFLSMYSCSQNENVIKKDSNILLQREGSSVEVDRLKSVFVNDILTSDIHIEYQNKMQDMLVKLKGNIPRAGMTQNDFDDWIKTELNNTNFVSVQEANNLYFELISSMNDYTLEFKGFFDKLESLKIDDVNFILQPGLYNPPTQTTACGSCSENCMDNCSEALNELEWSVVYDMADSDEPIIEYLWHRWNYWSNFQGIIDTYNNCLAGCC